MVKEMKKFGQFVIFGQVYDEIWTNCLCVNEMMKFGQFVYV